MTRSIALRRPLASAIRRLYGDVSATALLAAFGLVAVFALGRGLPGLGDIDGEVEFGAWLAQLANDFAGHAAVAAVLVALVAPAMRLAPDHGWRRAAVIALALAVALAIASLGRIAQLAWLTAHPHAHTWRQWLDQYFLRFFVRYGYLAALFVSMVELHRHARRSLAAMQRAELDRLALDREMAAARLQVLQAQIEPHFLFNTLANVRRLYRTHAATGRVMLDNLMRYLEVALPRMRDEASTLAREGALVDAYLKVQQIRMGCRLRFEIAIPPALGELAVPPMMLLTLVENALRHGLAPLPEGGLVRLDARLDPDGLRVRVSDDGCGLGEGTSGTGTGLANIRGRLEAMFGDRAGLELSANAPRGVIAALRLPVAGARA